MCKSVKTTRISGGAEYAKVADRLLAFREANPRSKIAQKVNKDDAGNITIKAYVWKDKSEYMELLKAGVGAEIALESADAEGSALAVAKEIEKQKGYEKHETIAIGRALALLGYSASGEIASSEEMEQFEQFKEDQRQEAIAGTIEKLERAKDLEELKNIFIGLKPEIKGEPEVIKAKEDMKAKLSEVK